VKARIYLLREKIHDGIDFSLDRLFSEAQDTYFLYEEQLEELDRLLTAILGEADRTIDQGGIKRLFERIQFLEDRFEEIDSGLRGRPMRARRRFSFYGFFRSWQESNSSGSTIQSEISSSAEAYEILGVKTGTPLPAITAAFRRSVKSLHPDVRGGDRSAEPALRKLIAAYQLIKKEFTRK